MIRAFIFTLYKRVFRLLVGTPLARIVWQLPGSRTLYRLLMLTFSPSTVAVNGHSMVLDPTDSLLLSVNGEYEPFELALFEACVAPGDVVVDVGAHIGLYTLAAARATGMSGTVHSFEPSSSNFEVLMANIDLNGYDNVRASRIALSDTGGTGTLSKSDINTGDNFLVARAETVARGESEAVALTTLDDYFSPHQGRVDVLKMDVQGGEPAVLRGADRTVAANDLLIFTEVSPLHLGGTAAAAAFVADLVDRGFRIFVVDERTATLHATDASGIEAAISVADADSHVNLVCARGGAARRKLLSHVVADVQVRRPARRS